MLLLAGGVAIAVAGPLAVWALRRTTPWIVITAATLVAAVLAVLVILEA